MVNYQFKCNNCLLFNPNFHPVSSLTVLMRKKLRLSVLLLVVAFVGARAQKIDQAINYLGQTRYTHEMPKGQVIFRYEGCSLLRIGDGKKSYSKLLTSYPGFNNAGCGNLDAILVQNVRVETGEELINRQKAAAKAAKKAQKAAEQAEARTAERPQVVPPDPSVVRPEPVPAQPRLEPVAFKENQPPVATTTSEPVNIYRYDSKIKSDSAMIVNKVNTVANSIVKNSGTYLGIARETWHALMNIFWAFFSVLLCLSGLLWYISSSSARESIKDKMGNSLTDQWMLWVYQNVTGALALLIWTMMAVLIVNIFLTLASYNLPIPILIPAWLGVLMIVNKFTDRLIPNVRVTQKKIGPN